MAFTITGTLIVDETSGLQNDDAPPGSDATGNDVADALGAPLVSVSAFNTLLSIVVTQNISSVNVTLSVSNGSTDDQDGSPMLSGFGADFTDMAFTNSTGGALTGVPALYSSLSTSFLRTADGAKIFLYSYSALVGVRSGVTQADLPNVDENNVVFGLKGTLSGSDYVADPNGIVVFAAYLQPTDAAGEPQTTDAGAVGAKVWLIRYDEIQHPLAGSTITEYDDAVSLHNLYVSTSNRTDFDLNKAPSGNNLFLMFGDGSPAAGEAGIVVTGKVPINQSDPGSGAISGGDTVVSSQGGGQTVDITLGTNNQMIDPLEGMWFSFVNLAADSLPLTVPNLSENEADIEANIKFASYRGANEVIFRVVQLQPPKAATMKISAFNVIDATEVGTGYIDGLNDGDDAPVNITEVTINRTVKTGNTTETYTHTFVSDTGTVEDPTALGQGLKLNFAGTTVTIEGVLVGDVIDYKTGSVLHNRVLIENVGNTTATLNASFDIGDFSVISSTTTPNQFSALTFQDDGPAVSSNQTAQLDDDAVTGAGGNEGGVGDDTDSANVSGTLGHNYGADGAGTVKMLATGATLPADFTAAVNGTGTVLTISQTSTGLAVLTVTLTNETSGAYTVAQVNPIKHPAGSDENNLSFTVAYRVTDRDGDTADGTLSIDVDDDTPTAGGSAQTGTVDEDALTGQSTGIDGGPGDIGLGVPAAVSGSIAAIFSPGADQPVTYSLSNETSGIVVKDSAGGTVTTLTSRGDTVKYDVIGDTLWGFVDGAGGTANVFDIANDRQVFKLVLTDPTNNGNYTFTLIDQLDHPATVGGDDSENELLLHLGSVLQVTDKDGDTATAAANQLVITVDDDTPTATGAAQTGTVDEDALTGGIDGGPDDIGLGVPALVSGSIAAIFASGADEPVVYSLSNETTGIVVKDSAGGTVTTLTSKGDTVKYDVIGDTLWGFVDGAGGTANVFDIANDRQVFKLVLTDPTNNGNYTFTLLDQLDHPDTVGGNDSENELLLHLGSVLQVTDKDGDTVTAAANKLVITVDDDTPIVTAKSNLVYANSSNTPPSTDPGGTGVFAYAIGADERLGTASLSNSDFVGITLTGTVGTDPDGAGPLTNVIQNATVTPFSENDSTAVFTVQFSYLSNSPNQGDSTTNTGTLTFDKTAGTYTLKLQEIETFSILKTSQALSFQGYDSNSQVEDNSGLPDVSVAKLADEFQVQFVGFNETGGNTPVGLTAVGVDAGDHFAEGELFAAPATTVSASGNAIGVASDTLQPGEVMDMDFWDGNPKGLEDPSGLGVESTTSRAIFLKFDGIGLGADKEDLVVVLKLVNTADPNDTTTRAFIVDNADIIQTGSVLANPPQYGIALDQNDGAVIFEKNDYNFSSDSVNYEIYGAQVLTSTQGLTGEGYNLNGAVGSLGGTLSTSVQDFGDENGEKSNKLETGEAATWDGDVIKISDIGFVTDVTPDAQLSFQVAVKDRDADVSGTQTLAVTIVGEGGTTASADPDTFVISDTASIDLLHMVMHVIGGGFVSGTDKLDMPDSGGGFVDGLGVATSLADFIADANTALNGTTDFYFDDTGGDGFLAFDADGLGITTIVQLVGVTSMTAADII